MSPALCGRQPPWYSAVDDAGRPYGKPWRGCILPRRVPWFRADGRITLGTGWVVGPWKPWRVPHRFVRGSVATAVRGTR